MGSPSGEANRVKDETQHRVTLTRGYYMQTTEVTQGQWKRVMGTRPWSGKEYVQENENNPAVYVSWNDCREFIKRLNGKEGTNKYRLPTEAEWEYACRAGSTTRFCFGDSDGQLGNYAWYEKNAWDVGDKYAHGAGTKRLNAWGLYDMHGNVWEWCHDWYGEYPSGSVTDPRGPSEGSARVNRGGSWSSGAGCCRSALRSWITPGIRRDFLGFRLAFFRRSVEQQQAGRQARRKEGVVPERNEVRDERNEEQIECFLFSVGVLPSPRSHAERGNRSAPGEPVPIRQFDRGSLVILYAQISTTTATPNRINVTVMRLTFRQNEAGHQENHSYNQP